MALPARKHGRARRDKSRIHWRLRLPGLTKCAQCGKPLRPHRVCLGCGYYRGRQVLVIAQKQAKEKGTRGG
jgi:large subunit ribosomal protein L32